LNIFAVVKQETTNGAIGAAKCEKVYSIQLYLVLVPAPTTKAVGYIDVIKLEPTALVVGLQPSIVTDGFSRRTIIIALFTPG